MGTSKLFAFGLLTVGSLLSSVQANAACDYSNPSVSLSIRSPGSSANVEVGVARISTSVTQGSVRSSLGSNCSSNPSSTTYIYIDNRYIGSNFVDFNTAQVADGLHTISVDASDSNGGRAYASQRIIVRNNWIRPEIYSQGDYLALNNDVLNAFGGDPGRTLQHWLLFGVNEGRQANLMFSSKEYLEINADLANAFGADYSRAIEHYLVFGINEGRATVFSLRPEVFNIDFYYWTNGDLRAAFPNDINGLKRHWLDYGLNEGRRGTENFSAKNYMERYGDLQAAFGSTNYRAGLRHYLQNGINEGRSGQ